jgi:hypothetical protein
MSAVCSGGYTGARIQPRLPETAIRRVLGLLVLAIGIRYAWIASETAALLCEKSTPYRPRARPDEI